MSFGSPQSESEVVHRETADYHGQADNLMRFVSPSV